MAQNNLEQYFFLMRKIFGGKQSKAAGLTPWYRHRPRSPSFYCIILSFVFYTHGFIMVSWSSNHHILSIGLKKEEIQKDKKGFPLLKCANSLLEASWKSHMKLLLTYHCLKVSWPWLAARHAGKQNLLLWIEGYTSENQHSIPKQKEKRYCSKQAIETSVTQQASDEFELNDI